MKPGMKIIGETVLKKQPVIAYRKYGKGEILIACIPLQLKSGQGVLAQLISNAVTLFGKDVYTGSELTRVLPIDIVLDNKGDAEKKLTVKELLPYGVEGYDCSPQPDLTDKNNKNNKNNDLKWTITIPGNSKKEIAYWLKLPDKVNMYDIKTEIYEGETKLEGVSLSFDVNLTIASGIDELITELESLELTGKDSQKVKRAVSLLNSIRSRGCVGSNNCRSVLEYFNDLNDSVQASALIGSVTGIDTTELRLKAQNIMIAIGRRFYDKAKTDGYSILNAINGFLTVD